MKALETLLASNVKAFGTLVILALLCFAFTSKAQNSNQNPVQPVPPDANSLITLDPSLQMALGGGKSGSPGTDIEIFNIAAHSGPLGVDSRGHVHGRSIPGSTFGTFDLSGDVTCFTLVGNTASVGGILTDLELNGVPDTTFHGTFFSVQDNHLLGVPDQTSVFFVSTFIPTPNAPCPFNALWA